MAMDYYIDFTGMTDGSGLPDTFTALLNSWAVNAGGLRPSGLYEATAYYNTALSGDTVGAAITIVSNVTAGGDALGPTLYTADGAGYFLELSGTGATIRKRNINSGRGSGIGAAIALTGQANGDEYKLTYSPASGALTAYQNTNVVATRADTDYQSAELFAGIFGNAQNNNGRRIGAFGADGLSVGPSIVSINTGSIESGSAGNSMVVSGFASPVATLTVGGLAMTAVTNASGDNYTFTDPGFIDGDVDPGFGALSAVASNVGETSSGFNVTRTIDSELTAVVLGALSEDPETIAVKAAAQGLTIAAADTLYYGDGLTIYGDGTISDAEDGDHEVWHRDEATDVMTLIIVTIGEGAAIGVGITMRALTASAITMRNLTMRSL